jgi:hypothetical protein
MSDGAQLPQIRKMMKPRRQAGSSGAASAKRSRVPEIAAENGHAHAPGTNGDARPGLINGHAMTLRSGEVFCEVDMPRQFGSADLRTAGMVSGWAEPEEGHNWNNGKETAYGIATEAPVPRLTLEIVGQPYITQLRPAQEMTVYGNGFRLGYKRMSSQGDVLLSILLLPQWWFVEGHRATMHLVFHLPLSIRPKDVGDSEDGRELAFAFQSLCLRHCDL